MLNPKKISNLIGINNFTCHCERSAAISSQVWACEEIASSFLLAMTYWLYH